MKYKKKLKNLAARREAWDAMRHDWTNGKNKKKINRQEYTRPGSPNK